MSNTLTGREVLRLIADGVSIEEFEYVQDGDDWNPLNGYVPVKSMLTTSAQFRRKPKTHIVNGFTVPAPETKVPPNKCDYYMPDVYDESWFCHQKWDEVPADRLWLRRGLVFLDKDAAIANAKAMCGIDPSKGEEK